jgi:radical SAM superfamily enzyme YgiQ (UPF0313 family)
MSSLGYQWITTLLRQNGLSAERIFLPDEPRAWRAAKLAPVSYETGTPLSRFPVLAVSLAYELELAGLLELLSLAGIPLLREDRTSHDPLIILGGPITMASPMIVAPFVDAVLLGEAEQSAPAATAAAFDCDSRESWLDAISALPGAWIPERDSHRLPLPAKATDEMLPARSAWISPDAELSSMFLMEGERGCHRQCTFCVMRRGGTLGGMRLVTPERLLALVPDHASKVGLVGAAISDHPQLVDILEVLVGTGRQVSLSSLRADRLVVRPKITQLLRRSGARTLTVASDGASARLRKQIIKKTSEHHLLDTAKQAGLHNFDVFKVYMIIGLPDETDEDIDELVRFTLQLADAAKPARLALGVAPFVAKKNTPLDGEAWAGTSTVERRMKRLTRGLKGRAEVRPVSARWAWVEYELSQGGAEAGLAVMEAWKAGGRFADWKRALKAVDPASRRPWARGAA